MQIAKGTKGLDLTFQDDFPEVTQCPCGGTARVAFVAAEEKEEGQFICDLHDNNIGKGGFWPHDAAAFAVYLCPQCFDAVTLWNQA